MLRSPCHSWSPEPTQTRLKAAKDILWYFRRYPRRLLCPFLQAMRLASLSPNPRTLMRLKVKFAGQVDDVMFKQACELLRGTILGFP